MVFEVCITAYTSVMSFSVANATDHWQASSSTYLVVVQTTSQDMAAQFQLAPLEFNTDKTTQNHEAVTTSMRRAAIMRNAYASSSVRPVIHLNSTAVSEFDSKLEAYNVE